MTETDDRINVLVAIDFSDDILQQLQDVSNKLNIQQKYPDIEDDDYQDIEILYTVRHFPTPEQAPRLRWIQLNYAGMETILDRQIVQAEDVTVTSASGIHVTQMAHFCLMMMMAFNYNLPTMLEHQKRGEWASNRFQLFNPVDMAQQTVGIVGYGSIGRELARLADSMGMTVLASKRDVKSPEDTETYTPNGTGDPTGDIPERIYPGQAIASMAKDCDYLVATAPLTDATKHLIDEHVFEAMKPTSILINVSRGGLVDEPALINALAAEQIGGAALDVFEEEPLPSTSPLWNFDNVIISPHVSGFVGDYHQKAADLFVENLKRYLDNQPLLNVLNRETGY